MSSCGRVCRAASCPCARNQLDKRLLSAQQYSKSLRRLHVDDVDRLDRAQLTPCSRLRDMHRKVEEGSYHDQWDTLVALHEAGRVLELRH
eukprot:12841945-Heterocapsa_arctica.AAC.1